MSVDDIDAMQLMLEQIQDCRELLFRMEREIARVYEQLENQSYTIRELAKYLAEHGVEVTRFTPRTTTTLIAVALNGDY